MDHNNTINCSKPETTPDRLLPSKDYRRCPDSYWTFCRGHQDPTGHHMENYLRDILTKRLPREDFEKRSDEYAIPSNLSPDDRWSPSGVPVTSLTVAHKTVRHGTWSKQMFPGNTAAQQNKMKSRFAEELKVRLNAEHDSAVLTWRLQGESIVLVDLPNEAKELQSLIGVLNWVCAIIPAGRAFLQPEDPVHSTGCWRRQISEKLPTMIGPMALVQDKNKESYLALGLYKLSSTDAATITAAISHPQSEVHGPTRPRSPFSIIVVEEYTLSHMKHGGWKSCNVEAPAHKSMANISQQAVMAVSAFRQMMASMDLPVPSESSLQNLANRYSDIIEEENAEDMERWIDAVQQVNTMKGNKAGTAVRVQTDTIYQTPIGRLRGREPGQPTSHSNAICVEEVSARKKVIANHIRNKNCGMCKFWKSYDLEAPDHKCTANSNKTHPSVWKFEKTSKTSSDCKLLDGIMKMRLGPDMLENTGHAADTDKSESDSSRKVQRLPTGAVFIDRAVGGFAAALTTYIYIATASATVTATGHQSPPQTPKEDSGRRRQSGTCGEEDAVEVDNQEGMQEEEELVQNYIEPGDFVSVAYNQGWFMGEVVTISENTTKIMFRNETTQNRFVTAQKTEADRYSIVNRDVMPDCMTSLVRECYQNPPGIPYMGQKARFEASRHLMEQGDEDESEDSAVEQLQTEPFLAAVHDGILKRQGEGGKLSCVTCSSRVTSCTHVSTYKEWCKGRDVDPDLVFTASSEPKFEFVSTSPVPHPWTQEMKEKYHRYADHTETFPRYLVPDVPSGECSHGHAWDDRDPVVHQWIQHAGVCIYTCDSTLTDFVTPDGKRHPRIVFYRPTVGDCGCRQYYDGSSDLLHNIDNRTMMFFGFLFDYLHSMVGRQPLRTTHRVCNSTRSVCSFFKMIPYETLRRGWNSWARRLDIEWGKVSAHVNHGPEDEIINARAIACRVLAAVDNTPSQPDVVIPDEWARTWGGRQFLSYQDNDLGILVFGTNRNFSRLRHCSVLYMDGTFKTCPRPYSQFFTIHGLYHGRAIPFVMALMTTKTVGAYRQVLQHVKEKVLEETGHELNPRMIVSDFVLAIISANEF
ncbi:hypothetical protein Bbelb_349400 [Branchiostoma belcheri]|nr:hypothetical protein Bbelb_349400 [Branchiostoma belcheri]